MKTKEDVILDILSKQPSIFIQLAQHDRKGLAHTISQILDAVNELESEMKHKNASDEALAKLELIKITGDLHDQLKKIAWYKFSERGEMKLKILELESRLRYGWHFKIKKEVEVVPI